MATAAHARGRGAGAAVLDALVRHAAARGATRVWCNARTPARSLYERAGFTVVSDEFELPEIGPHFVMELRIKRARVPRASNAAPARSFPRQQPVKGWSRSTFGQAGRGRTGK